MIQAKLLKKLWAELMLTAVEITNWMSTSTKLYSELFSDEFYEITTSYKVWKDVSYDHMNNVLMIDTDVYVQMKDPEHKKTDKTDI